MLAVVVVEIRNRKNRNWNRYGADQQEKKRAESVDSKRERERGKAGKIDEKNGVTPEAERSYRTADKIATDDQCDGEGPCPFRLTHDQKQRNKETQHRQKKNKPQFNRS